MPESSIRKFGEWIVSEGLRGDLTPSQQTKVFEDKIQEMLNKFCPEKTVRISSKDKPWVTGELKAIARLKSREYNKRGKTERYKDLAKQFTDKYNIEADKYLRKNMDELIECKPGQAYSVLKKMGAQPGDCIDSNTFTLPSHESENLNNEQCAEQIANYFAQISQEFSPLNRNLLPPRVQCKLDSPSVPPTIYEYDTYQKIKSAKKPKSGVPGDLPRAIVQEFGPELATPVNCIINNIVQSCEWPGQWKQEWVTPIGKIPTPETEDDLRPISLTPFFSKVTEHFVVMWLLDYIGHLIDFRQYGGTKGNSITLLFNRVYQLYSPKPGQH